METIKKFYSAFKALDAETMVSYYHDDIIFEDPAFGVLKGQEAKNMWRMLIASQKGKNFEVTAFNIIEVETKGSAQWEAKYTFSKTGRNVHNKITAEFELKDGKIINHKDAFNLYKWSRQAMGVTGTFLGWTPFFKNKVRTMALKGLKAFSEKNN